MRGRQSSSLSTKGRSQKKGERKRRGTDSEPKENLCYENKKLRWEKMLAEREKKRERLTKSWKRSWIREKELEKERLLAEAAKEKALEEVRQTERGKTPAEKNHTEPLMDSSLLGKVAILCRGNPQKDEAPPISQEEKNKCILAQQSIIAATFGSMENFEFLL